MTNKLPRGPICLNDDGTPNHHMNTSELAYAYNSMKYWKYEKIKEEYDRLDWQKMCTPIRVIVYTYYVLKFIGFFVEVMCVAGLFAMNDPLSNGNFIGKLLIFISAMGGLGLVSNYILSPICDRIGDKIRIRKRIALIKCGYSPFSKAWSFKKWYTHNYKYYENGMSYTHPSGSKDDELDPTVCFYKWN